MKMTKKKVFVTALIISLIAIISMGSLAWFNDSDSITNNFKVATDKDDPDPTFSVDIYETDIDGTTTEDGVTYYNVVPGKVIDKDPTIVNSGDYTQWIRVSVTMTKANYWKNFGGSLKFTDLFSGSTYGLAANVADAKEKWLLVENEATPNTNGDAVWYLYLNREFAAGSDEVLFNQVKIDEDFTLEEIMSLGGEFAITVNAEAVQRDNTGDNAVAAFKNVGWDAGTKFVDKDN